MKITAKILRKWEACWTDDEIRTRMGRRKSVTPREVANDESITLDDRLWVVTKALWHLDETAARLYAIESAELVAHLAGDEDDQAQYLGLMNEMRQIELELDPAARDAARGAAWGAAWDAARGAAWDAARGAARDAAWGAAWNAAWGAARGAAWDAAWDAARDAAWGAALRKAIDRALDYLGTEAGSGMSMVCSDDWDIWNLEPVGSRLSR